MAILEWVVGIHQTSLYLSSVGIVPMGVHRPVVQRPRAYCQRVLHSIGRVLGGWRRVDAFMIVVISGKVSPISSVIGRGVGGEKVC